MPRDVSGALPARMKIPTAFSRSNQPGWFADQTLSNRFLLPLLLGGFLLGVAWPELGAQEDFSVPGLTDPVEDTPAAGASPEGLVTEDDTTLFGLIAKGGWAMWVLGAFSFAVVGLAIYCAMDLRRVNFCPQPLQDSLRDSFTAGDLEGINQAVHGDPTTLARMTESVAEYIGETGYSTDDNELLRGMMAEAGQKTNRLRARVVNYFSVIAQASPMMGLLGTVSGMIKAFGSLGKTGMAKPDELAEHISEALVTTATGLIIALPAIFLYFFFRDRIEELILECEDFGADMLTILRRSAIAAAAGIPEEVPPDGGTVGDADATGGEAEEKAPGQ